MYPRLYTSSGIENRFVSVSRVRVYVCAMEIGRVTLRERKFAKLTAWEVQNLIATAYALTRAHTCTSHATENFLQFSRILT